MAGFPDAQASNVLDYVTGRAVADSAPASVYIALLTSDPGASATVATLPEDNTAGYARQQIVFGVPAGSPPNTSNSAQITVGPFTAAQANPVTHIALVTSSSGTGGNVRWVQPLSAGFQAASGDSLVFPVGSVNLGFLSN